MLAVLLLIPIALFIGLAQDDPPAATAAAAAVVAAAPPPAAAAPPSLVPEADSAAESYRAAKANLAAGRLTIAAYFFELAVRQGDRRPDVYEALALTYFRMQHRSMAETWRTQALAQPSRGEWALAMEAARGTPVVSTNAVAAVAESSPPLGAARASGCAVMLTALDGSEPVAKRVWSRLSGRGVDVDCLANEPLPAAEATVIRYRPGAEATAARIAGALSGPVERRRTDTLAHEVEVRVGRKAAVSGVQLAGMRP
ncbi:MAG: LytR C-terminal domain-containing protein [Magnetospirillum sp.]|nr:LytR C-terminal domain-containing protein [Magnetospirillum sp.]